MPVAAGVGVEVQARIRALVDLSRIHGDIGLRNRGSRLIAIEDKLNLLRLRRWRFRKS